MACGGCNNRKAAKTTAIDPLTEMEVPLFHPRQNVWRDHFQWNDDFTQMTELLQLNRNGLIQLRAVLFKHGNFPPQ